MTNEKPTDKPPIIADHTPGPWEAVPSVPSDGSECYWLQQPICGQNIGAIYGPQSGEQEANARIIAAAPELLLACERAFSEMKGDYVDDVWGRDLAYLTSVISKVRGRV